MKVEISDKAREELEKITSENKRTAKIVIAGSRCIVGTPNLTLEFVNLKEDDKVVDADGVKITYNEEISEFIDNVKIDYTEEGLKRGFNVEVAD